MKNIDRVYIKNINLDDSDFVAMITGVCPCRYAIEKNTFILFDVPEQFYRDLCEFKIDLSMEGKTILISTGGI